MIRNVKHGDIFTDRRANKAAKRHAIVRAVLILLLPAALLLQFLAARSPEVVEQLYSRCFYRAFSGVVSKYFNLFPFSCAEIMLYAAVIFGVFFVALAVIRIFRRQGKALLRMIVTVCCIGTTGYFLFVAMWGLNYCREPLEKSLGYKAGTATTSEVSAMMKSEVKSINTLCGKISYDKKGRSYYTIGTAGGRTAGGFTEISAGTNDGYMALAKKNMLYKTFFGGGAARPKGILASKLMSYTGIGGIFVPFTYEPNVDTDLPTFVQAFDAAHESAHFKGFAREDEANFVAYLSDTANSAPYFQYSARLEAYIYLSNALYTADNASWRKFASKLDRRAAGDLKYYNDYIEAHKSKAADISNSINDSYLKLQGQQGVVTYDMFVTLLADRYRTAK